MASKWCLREKTQPITGSLQLLWGITHSCNLKWFSSPPSRRSPLLYTLHITLYLESLFQVSLENKFYLSWIFSDHFLIKYILLLHWKTRSIFEKNSGFSSQVNVTISLAHTPPSLRNTQLNSPGGSYTTPQSTLVLHLTRRTYGLFFICLKLNI